MKTSRSKMELFWQKVEKMPGGCWEWRAAIVFGYGKFSVRAGHMVPAHRWLYERIHGPVDSKMTLDHLCRNRACVNPDHLEVVTRGENVLRGISPPARNAQKTHCPKGHEYTQENTYRPASTGWRQCRTCQKLRWKKNRLAPVASFGE